MVSFEIKTNVQDLNAAIREWRRGVQMELLPNLAERVKEKTRIRVSRTKTTPDGRRWKKRKSSRERHGLMTKTRKLLRSIRTMRQGRNAYDVGSALDYAAFQHFGTRRGIPARQIMGLGRRDLKDLEDSASAWAMKFGSRIRSLARALR